jgi:4-amino-4-deoxy-L-arabinose transferase-like glycosyltransferase
MTTATLPIQPSFLKKNLFLGVTISTVLVIAIMAFSFGLHMYNIQSIGDANAYYTAAVKSMLQSWSNFFFVAAEPGGSVTVDKPPLGLWIEAVFAYFLGVSGFSVSLPNILAGVFGIPLLYVMVKKYMGELAGLVAAFVMAITPVFVATNRNNTMDGLLVFFLLAAAWVFIKATESGKLPWLLLGAFIVGLGFNIKMMQAFLPLPAFYALYFFGSKEGWLRKIINLGVATVLLLAVSLSWAVIVDLTPANSRPYIGSSENNTVMGLIFGHNGISRLESTGGPGGGGPQNGTRPASRAPFTGTDPNQGTQPQQGLRQGPPQEALDACANSTQGSSCSFTQANGNTINGSCIIPPNLGVLACAPQRMNQPNGQGQAPVMQTAPQQAVDACENSTQGADCSFNLKNGNTINGSCIIPPNSTDLACAPQGMIPQGMQGMGGPNGSPGGGGGGTPFGQETGSPGVFRFFTQPLSKQMSWLLPFALISVLLALFGSRIQLPIESGVHKALILWGGWLLTCVVFFSMVSGIFHSYYAIMLAPPLGAMVGIGFAQLWSWSVDKKWVGIVLVISAALTIGFQLFAMIQYGESIWWMFGSGILLGLGILLMFTRSGKRLAYVAILAAMMVIPLYWTVMTVSASSNINLPSAYMGGNQQAGPDGINRPRQQGGGPGSNMNEDMLAYLQANTANTKYMLAVPSSQNGATLVIATGRPVLYMGGFGGQDDVVSAEDLSAMVANGELRYVLYGGEKGGKEDIANWLKTSCSVVPEFSQSSSGVQRQAAQGPNSQQGPGNQNMTLYMCK